MFGGFSVKYRGWKPLLQVSWLSTVSRLEAAPTGVVVINRVAAGSRSYRCCSYQPCRGWKPLLQVLQLSTVSRLEAAPTGVAVINRVAAGSRSYRCCGYQPCRGWKPLLQVYSLSLLVNLVLHILFEIFEFVVKIFSHANKSFGISSSRGCQRGQSFSIKQEMVLHIRLVQ